MNSFFARNKYFIVIAFMSVALGYLLFLEHQAHILPFLPYLILLLCPLMHLFMHRGHNHSDDNEKGGNDDA